MKNYVVKTFVYDSVEVLHFVFGFLKPLFRPFVNKLRSKKIETINNIYQTNALSVLKEFDDCLTKNSIPYTLAFGTLLGAIREKGFIKHDLDIDTAVWVEQDHDNIKLALKKYGFDLIHTFLVEEGLFGREETYEKCGVHIDIFYFYPAKKEYPYCCDFLRWPTCRSMYASMRLKGKILARRIEMPMVKTSKRVPFENLLLPVPENAEELLKFRYGEDYMVPNPNWTQEGTYDKHIIEWPEVKAVVQKGFEPWPYGM